MAASYLDNGGLDARSPSTWIDATYPSTNAGDLLLLIVSNDTSYGSNTVSGWTRFIDRHNHNQTVSVHWKIATGSESGVQRVYCAGSGSPTFGMMLRVTGADQTTPINASAAASQNAASGWNIPSVTTTVDDCLVLGIVCIDDNVDVYNETDYTEIISVLTAVGSDGHLWVGSQVKATAGVVAADGMNTGTADDWALATVAIAPGAVSDIFIPKMMIF